MTLRARLAVLTAVAVALAVLAASVAAWLLIRSTMLSGVDDQLLGQAPGLGRVMIRIEDLPPGAEAVAMLQGDPMGIQRLGVDGRVEGAFPSGSTAFEPHPDELPVLAGETRGPVLFTVTIEGVPYRVMTVAADGLTARTPEGLPSGDADGLPPGDADDLSAEDADRFSAEDLGGPIRLLRSLEEVERTMSRMAWLLAGVATLGVALAGGLGWLVARSGLRPVRRLAAAAEQVATTKDLAHRVDVAGDQRDEVTRLAGSMNTMLAALDGARTQQRQLVENAGHELRTPLATLRNDIGLLRRAEQHPQRSLTAADRAALLHDLETEAGALSDLVAELVDLARGGVEPEPFLETDLRALVERAVARTRRINPLVTVTVHSDPFEAYVRPAMLERAVANLVRNAVQVSPDGGVVEVELTGTGDPAEVSVRVRDRGPGIAEHDLPRLFDRFYRGEGARQRHGSGLGLAIVAQAAEQHGGRATAANRPGGGAVFDLHIPTHPPAGG